MTRRRQIYPVAPDVLVPVLDLIRKNNQVPTAFPQGATQEAQQSAERWQQWERQLHPQVSVAAAGGGAQAEKPWQVVPLQVGDGSAIPADYPPTYPRLDGTAIPLVTIDPPESKDLDQAIAIAKVSDLPEEALAGQHEVPEHVTQLRHQDAPAKAKYLLAYSIAALSCFVEPGSELDAEVHARGNTLYFPDGSVPLHPRELSAGAASLLPGQVTPSFLWRIALDEEGQVVSWRVDLAAVISRAQLDYQQVQDAVDGKGKLPPAADPALPALLQELGLLRIEREQDRGGVSLPLPEQEVEKLRGGYQLRFRASLPVENWNAHMSLLTGMCAAAGMRRLGVGVVRTLPPAKNEDVARLRRAARALGVSWPLEMSYPQLVPTLDEANPAHNAFMDRAASLFRGSGYLVYGPAIGGRDPIGELFPVQDRRVVHSAIAAEYAHSTAPLRRLVDRFSLELAWADTRRQDAGGGAAEEFIPGWVLDALPQLPSEMGKARQTGAKNEKEVIAAMEALTLSGHEGETYSGVILDAKEHSGHIMLSDPAIMAPVEGEDLPVGERVEVDLTKADLEKRQVAFALARAA